MKNTKFKLVLLVLSLLFSNIIFSQKIDSTNQNVRINDTTFVMVKDSTYVSLNINYISDAVFMGRKDSISTPYLYPSFTYHSKSGFYASGSLSYLTKSEESRVDLFLVTAGFDFTAKKLDGDISVTKYFFNDDSYNVISEVEADITALFKYDFDIINLGLTSSLYFSSDGSSDFFFSPEISHDFITKDQKLQITPTVSLNLGSQNFLEQYYINNRFGNGRGQGQGSSSNTQTNDNTEIQESEKFNLMAVEFGMPMWYVEKSLTLSFIPAIAIPQNPATLTVDDVVFEEDLENTFYWIVGVGYKF